MLIYHIIGAFSPTEIQIFNVQEPLKRFRSYGRGNYGWTTTCKALTLS